MFSFRIFLFAILIITLNACDDSRYKANLDEIEYAQEFKRLDQDLFSESRFTKNGLDRINTKYNAFSSIYFKDIMRIGDPMNAMTADLANRFIQDPTWRELQLIIDDTYPDLASENREIILALKNYGFHFKQNNLPKLVAYNSGYNVGVYPSDDWLGIGLEWYCGSDHQILDQLPPDIFPEYKRQKMLREYLVVNAVKGFLYFKFQDKLQNANVLNRIVFAGKIHFLTSVLLESEDLPRVLNYHVADYEWCENNSFLIWEYFLENDLFYNEDPLQINKLVGDGPFTPGMPTESPGGVGNWMGLRMVKKFMDENKNVSLEDLMKMENDQVFLEYYKLN